MYMYTLAEVVSVLLPELSSPTRCILRSSSKSSTRVPITASSQSYHRCHAAGTGKGDRIVIQQNIFPPFEVFTANPAVKTGLTGHHDTLKCTERPSVMYIGTWS